MDLWLKNNFDRFPKIYRQFQAQQSFNLPELTYFNLETIALDFDFINPRLKIRNLQTTTSLFDFSAQDITITLSFWKSIQNLRPVLQYVILNHAHLELPDYSDTPFDFKQKAQIIKAKLNEPNFREHIWFQAFFNGFDQFETLFVKNIYFKNSKITAGKLKFFIETSIQNQKNQFIKAYTTLETENDLYAFSLFKDSSQSIDPNLYLNIFLKSKHHTKQNNFSLSQTTWLNLTYNYKNQFLNIAAEQSIHDLLVSDFKAHNIEILLDASLNLNNQFSFTLDNLQIDNPNKSIFSKTPSNNNLSIEYSTFQHSLLAVSAKQLNLATVSDFLKSTFPPFAQTIQQFEPSGILSDVQFFFNTQTFDYFIASSLSNVSLQAFKDIPAFKGITGFLQIDKHSLILYVDSDQFEIYLPKIYKRPFPKQKVQGMLQANFSEKQTRIQIENAQAQSQLGEIVQLKNLHIILPSTTEDLSLSLALDFQNLSRKNQHFYIPDQILEPKFYQWLTHSIQGKNAQSKGQFSLNIVPDKPFTYLLEIQGKNFNWNAPEMPHLTGINPYVSLNKDRFQLKAHSAHLKQIKLTDISMNLGLQKSKMPLSLKANIKGHWETLKELDGFDWTQTVSDIINQDTLQLKGDFQSDLSISIPNIKAINPKKIDFGIDLALNSVEFYIPTSKILQQIKSKLHYSTQKGLIIHNFNAQLSNGDDFTPQAQTPPDNSSEVAQIFTQNLTLNTQALLKSFTPQNFHYLSNFFEGQSDHQFVLTLTPYDVSSRTQNLRLHFESDLLGTQSSLPLFPKPKDKPLNITTDLNLLLGLDFSYQLEHQFGSYKILSVLDQTKRISITNGGGVVPLPEDKNLIGLLHFESLNYKDVLGFYKGVIKPFLSSASTSPDQNNFDFSLLINVDSFDVHEMFLPEGFSFDIEKIDRMLAFNATGNEFEGSIWFNLDEMRPQIDVQYWNLTLQTDQESEIQDQLPEENIQEIEKSESDSEKAQASLTPLHDLLTQVLQPKLAQTQEEPLIIDAKIRKLLLNNILIGTLQSPIYVYEDVIQFPTIKHTHPGQEKPIMENSQLTIYYEEDQNIFYHTIADASLNKFLYNTLSVENFQINWETIQQLKPILNSQPQSTQFYTHDIEGDITFSGKEILIPSKLMGSSASRTLDMIGLLSIFDLISFLKLYEFSDRWILYNIIGAFNIRQGNMTTQEPFSLETPSFVLKSEGDINLINQTINHNTIIQLGLGKTVPLINILATIPTAGLIWAFGPTLKYMLDDISTLKYKIEGKWHDALYKLNKVE